ncbi:hypothetical protein [Aliiglaciecola litoralis]|uniref:DUF3149 domain-containing protein n=1 Tax=Aliiglaciecola litoralis TaxID=582857 RepID=A0ABP3X232_9ALTE
MTVNLWFFLTIGTILGVVFAIVVIYLNHVKAMKKLEIEALKYQNNK